jgi:hypothetical protein
MITKWISKLSISKNGNGRGTDPRFRIGDRVQSESFGSGVVRASDPKGTLIVHFDGQNKSHSIFPTFLKRDTQSQFQK